MKGGNLPRGNYVFVWKERRKEETKEGAPCYGESKIRSKVILFCWSVFLHHFQILRR